MAKIFFSFIIIVHGLIHLLGFVKAYDLAPVEQLTEEISKTTGLIWLLVSVLFLITVFLYFTQNNVWWIVGSTAVIISQVLIIGSWSDAKFGTIANLILILPIIIAFVGQLPTSYENRFKAEVEKGLSRSTSQELLTEDDITHLPPPVQKYIRYSGAIGKEKLQNFRAEFLGEFKTSPDSDFLDIRAVQYNFFDEPTRAFYIESSMYGLPINGLHLYVGPNASMQIKITSLLQVVDAKGPEMNRSETVTIFNDMCFLAPATLINKKIEWETIDSTSVKARFTNRGNTITAILFFNEAGQLINFSSEDRAESADGKSFINYKWATPLSNYRDFNGRNVASYGEAIWHKPEGEYCYAKVNLVDIKYNAKMNENIDDLLETY